MKLPEMKLPRLPKPELVKELRKSTGWAYLGDSLRRKDAGKLTVKPSEDGLQVSGPPEVIERLKSILRRLGARLGPKTP